MVQTYLKKYRGSIVDLDFSNAEHAYLLAKIGPDTAENGIRKDSCKEAHVVRNDIGPGACKKDKS